MVEDCNGNALVHDCGRDGGGLRGARRFDLGAGAIYLGAGRTSDDRRKILRAIGPVWDGNEVWLVAAGGTLYFAFPLLYASSFSGFYLPLMMVLWLLMLRGIGIELRRAHGESGLGGLLRSDLLRLEHSSRNLFRRGLGNVGVACLWERMDISLSRCGRISEWARTPASSTGIPSSPE